MDLLRALLATLSLGVACIAYGAEAASDSGADALRTAAAPEVRLGTIEVIADGDARLFKTPMKLTLTGGNVVGMVQVDEAIPKA